MSGEATLFELGAKARDRLTGIEGVLIAITTWHDRSNECAIQRTGLDADGHAYDLHWCPQSRLEVMP